MKTRYSLSGWILFFAFLLFIAAFEADIRGQPINEPLVTKRAKQDTPFQPTKFEFSIKGTTYLILSHGDGVRTDSRGKSDKFVLSLDEGYLIEMIQYLDREGDPIIIYMDSDSEGGAGHVVRIDSETLRPKWLTLIPGFNVGEAIAKDYWLYLTAIGFVGKLDLRTGRYNWKYDLFTEKPGGNFNAFERPVIEKDLVKFTECLLPPHYKGSPVTIVIDDHTGKILNFR